MTAYRPSPAKRRRLESLSTPAGVIAALAMDQRKSLRKMIAAAARCDMAAVTDGQLAEFKTAVSEELSRHASAILLDPEYGLDAASRRAPECGFIMTYEADGFENPRPHRMLALLPTMSVRRIRDTGAAAIKILLSWAPDNGEANDEKCALIERIGAECEALDMPFFLEPVVYDPAGMDPRSPDFARVKPQLVVRTMEEFSRPRYAVDVLKVEFPATAVYVQGSAVCSGESVHTREEALDWYRKADAAAACPYIYLSAGVAAAEFNVSLELAAEAGARFSGVLCGRANWQGGAAEYARGGVDALRLWLRDDGVRNILAVNERLRAATPWSERLASDGGGLAG